MSRNPPRHLAADRDGKDSRPPSLADLARARRRGETTLRGYPVRGAALKGLRGSTHAVPAWLIGRPGLTALIRVSEALFGHEHAANGAHGAGRVEADLYYRRLLYQIARRFEDREHVAMLLAFTRALKSQRGHPLSQAGADYIRKEHLNLSGRAATTGQYLKALDRVLRVNGKWLQIADEEGPEQMLRYLRKSVRLEARKMRAAEEGWVRRRCTTGRPPGRPGVIPSWVQSPRLTRLLKSGILPPAQQRVAGFLRAGRHPADAWRHARTGKSAYDALRRKVLRP